MQGVARHALPRRMTRSQDCTAARGAAIADIKCRRIKAPISEYTLIIKHLQMPIPCCRHGEPFGKSRHNAPLSARANRRSERAALPPSPARRSHRISVAQPARQRVCGATCHVARRATRPRPNSQARTHAR
jgi:hypothetical protein